MQTGAISITGVHLLNGAGETSKRFTPEDQEIVVSVTVQAAQDVSAPVYGIVLKREGAQDIVTLTNTRVQAIDSPDLVAGESATINFSFKNIFGDGRYAVTALIAETRPGGVYYDWRESATSFVVSKRTYDYVPLFLDQHITINKTTAGDVNDRRELN
jgi:hypothetical protein